MDTNSNTTMQIGSITLRKAAAGWEYRSASLQPEPEFWSPAGSDIEGLPGTALNALLDELLIAREQAAIKAQSVCRNCKWWLGGVCDFIDTIHADKVAASSGCEIVATADDDSGLSVVLKTGPNYSCPSFTESTSRQR